MLLLGVIVACVFFGAVCCGFAHLLLGTVSVFLFYTHWVFPWHPWAAVLGSPLVAPEWSAAFAYNFGRTCHIADLLRP